MNDAPLQEGWWLMSVADLEIELRRWREPSRAIGPSNATKLTMQEALGFRDAGNVPDALDRTLRLVLIVEPSSVEELSRRRLQFEPDFHSAPEWRREGSKPFNVVPLLVSRPEPKQEVAWWDDPDIKALEEEWSRTGAVAGVRIPEEYRSFVYKTVLALRVAGREVTVRSLSDSIARWLPPHEADRIKQALIEANPNAAG